MRAIARFLIIAVIALAACHLAAGCGRPKPKAAEETTVEEATPVVVTQAQVGNVQQVETLTGSVEPWREVDVQSEVMGKVAWVGYDVGDYVSAGSALVRLDTALSAAGYRQSTAAELAAKARHGQSRVGLKLTDEETSGAIRQAEKSLDAARNRLGQAKTAAQLTRSRVENAIAQAKIGVSSARSRLDDIKAGSRNQELAQAQSRLQQTQSALRLAKTNLARVQRLAQDGAVAQAQLDAAQVEYETAQSQVTIAEQALDLAKEGARSEQVRLTELGVAQAESLLADAESQRGQIDVAERDVRAAEVAVAQAEEALTLARTGRRRVDASAQEVRAAAAGAKQAAAAANYSRTSLGKHVVYAPISGQVALRSVEPGESAQPGLPLLRLVAMDTVRITCRASDLQVAAMRVGQLGKVTVGALPGAEMLGRITDIAPQAEVDRRVFHVRLQVRNEGRKLRAGMFAQVQVVTAQHSSVTWIPRDAMVERGEDRVVYQVVDGKTKVRKVKIGAIDGLRVEIRSGVRPGDTLILGGQSQLADGQKVKPVKAGAETETGPGPAASS